MSKGMLREALAAYAHDAWAGWTQYVFDKSTANPDGTVTIPAWAVKRWKRQIATAYADLPEDEKASDRAEADRMLAIVAPVLRPFARMADALPADTPDDRMLIAWNAGRIIVTVADVRAAVDALRAGRESE